MYNASNYVHKWLRSELKNAYRISFLPVFWQASMTDFQHPFIISTESIIRMYKQTEKLTIL